MEPVPVTPVREPVSGEGPAMGAPEGQQGRSLSPPPLQINAGPPATPPAVPPTTPPPPGEGPGQNVQPSPDIDINALLEGLDRGQAPSSQQTASAPVCTQVPAHGVRINPGADLQTIRFLDKSVTVSRDMAAALQRVDAELRRQYNALPCDANRPATLEAFTGLVSIHGQDNRHGYHAHGGAVDCNVIDQGYIATRNFGPDANGDRTQPSYGGEAPRADTTRADRRGIMDARVAFTEVLDRAVQFMRRDPDAANRAELHNRETNETVTHAYRRFAAASDALAAYFQLALHSEHHRVSRRPIPNAAHATPEQLEARIPLRERLHPADGILNIWHLRDDPNWQRLHPNETRSHLEIYYQILRDYEMARIPLLHGRPTPNPAATRNPARGILHMPERFVRAMVEVGGLRWGACMFGASESGDVHHFDLGASDNGTRWTNSEARHSGALSHQEDDARR